LRNILFLYILVTFSLALVVSMVCSSSAAVAQTSANGTNTAAAANNTAGPVGGFTGYATVKNHVYDAPLLDVHIYCGTASGGILASCLVFDGNSTNATLIGIEYIISDKQYASLPDREKPNWTPVSEEARSDLRFPNLTPQQIQGFFKYLEGAYTKLIITWDPKDNLPLYPPQIIIESLIGHNETKEQR
jgi:hypothetical protein